MSGKKRLTVYPSLGETFSVGWQRDDVPMVHVFASVRGGELIVPAAGPQGGPHWPCRVCAAHNYTEADFWEQIKSLAIAAGDA